MGSIIKSIPVIDNVTDVAVQPMIATESTDSNNVFGVLEFLYLFFDLLFLSLKQVIISLNLFIWLLKLLTSFSFFSKLFSKPSFSNNGALGCILSAFCSIYLA